MKAVLLADRPDLIDELVAGYEAEWPEWYGPGGPGDAAADLRERARREGLPLGLVAVDGGELVGAVAITGPTIERWAHLTPWISGGWTRPERRRQGGGALMVRLAVEQARTMGFAHLYVATASAVSLMEREGWTLLEQVQHEGEVLFLFVIDLQGVRHGSG